MNQRKYYIRKWKIAMTCLMISVSMFTFACEKKEFENKMDSHNATNQQSDETKIEQEQQKPKEINSAGETQPAEETQDYKKESSDDISIEQSTEIENEKTAQVNRQEPQSLIHSEGTTLGTRILCPDGYERTDEDEGSLAEFLRSYPMKEDGSPVLLYNGEEKSTQDAHAAVFQLPIENEDLQQCADSVMRMYAEYYWSIEAYDKIAFHFTNGFLASLDKWQQGYRIKVSGNQVKWVKSASQNHSYESFESYLRVVFAYAGTLSMENESEPIAENEIQVGDIFIHGGSPGHVVMVVDICENQDGKKAFLLGQGYMPAQEFHVLKNTDHESDPWYYVEEITYPLYTPSYVFEEGSLRRLCY